ncbi:unnamed protein product [Effrenium voratum]|nr:unnamed protein product [Effrenium voratum]
MLDAGPAQKQRWSKFYRRSLEGVRGRRADRSNRVANVARVARESRAARVASANSELKSRELRELREVFELADTDCNGRISARELRSAMWVLGICSDMGSVRQTVAEFDVDGHGEINFEEFVRAASQTQSALQRAVNRGRILSRMSALFFDHDDFDTLGPEKVAQAAKSLSDMTDVDVGRLLGSQTPAESKRVASKEESQALPVGFKGMWDGDLWPSGARARARHFLQLCLCELAVVCLRVRVSSWVLNRVLRWRLVTLAARPIVTGRFLTLLVRHRRISEALLVFLRLPGAERGVVPLLYFDAQLAELCRAPDVDQVVGRLVGRHGMGSFFRRFIVTAPPQMLRRFIQHKATAQLVAKVVCQFSAARDSAAWAHRRRRELPAAVARACQEPGAELWAMHFCATPGVEEWLGALLSDPRGAGFAHRLLLEPGFIDKVEDFLGFKEARKFVIRLLRQPGVYRFVTWLNRDPEMQRWFARIAKREKPMVFITEMLQEPGLDKFIVGLLLRKGNDTALRSMLDFWVHTEGSFASVFGSFSKKPGVERALARVVISPGFLDGFVFRKFLWQDGLWELAVEAATLVGVRGLVDNVLPLTLAVLSAILAFYAQGDACPR